jgi:predicted phosphodiesterase
MHTLNLVVGTGTKVVVVSDLHIGDPRTISTLINVLDVALRLEKPDVLILAGDILEGDRATKEEQARLAAVCARTKNVLVLNGNHDSDATKRFAATVNADFGDCVVGNNSIHSFAVEHGNRFDSAWKKRPFIGHLAIWLNLLVYKVTKFDLQRWFRTFGWVIRNLKKQHQDARAAWATKDIVVTGHTHIPTGDASGTGYFNSGDWLIHRTYVVIVGDRARLEEIP